MSLQIAKFKLKALLTSVISVSSISLSASELLTESPVKPEAFVTMIVGLIAVIALIFILAALTKKMKLMQSFTTGHQIKNLASLALTNREKVCLIEVGGKQLLIGIAPGQVSSLHIFDESIQISSTDSASEKENVFSTHLKKALGLGVAETTSDKPQEQSTEGAKQ